MSAPKFAEIKEVVRTCLKRDGLLRLSDYQKLEKLIKSDGLRSTAFRNLNALKADQVNGTLSEQAIQSFMSMLHEAIKLDWRVVVCCLHGINTYADWFRPFNDLAPRFGLSPRTDRWYYGKFWIIHFLMPWKRKAQIEWLKEVYNDEVNDRRSGLTTNDPPSAVAHSFGTYILGYALLKYDWLKFDKIILCGCILPIDFPWQQIIERGQVTAIRNEYGAADYPCLIACWFVRDSGQAGRYGFNRDCVNLNQQCFQRYGHSDIFNKGHMEKHWVPFLRSEAPRVTCVENSGSISYRYKGFPAGLYAIIAIVVLSIMFAWRLTHWFPL